MNTDKGTNVLAILGVAAVSMEQMPDGNLKSILLTVISILGCVVLYLIKGESKTIDTSKSLEDVVKEGRDEDK